MQLMEEALYTLLNGKISVNGIDVPVLTRYQPLDEKPCITITQTANSDKGQPYMGDYQLPLPSTHPQYDSSKPDKLYPQQVRRDTYESSLQVNVWCDSEEERDSIVKQIHLEFQHLLNDYYTQCCNYSDGECITINEACPINTVINRHTVKGQCPNPTEYKYLGVLQKYYIHPVTVNVSQGFNQDEIDNTPPLLRTIIQVTMTYYTYHYLGGTISTDIKFKYI